MTIHPPLTLGISGSFWLPEPASTFAPSVDTAWEWLYWVCLVFFVIVVGFMFFFMAKYRRTKGYKVTHAATHNTPLEIAWSVIPLLIVFGFFFVGFLGFENAFVPPTDSLKIDLEAKKWNFTFTYPNGGVSSDLVIPVNIPVELVMNSVDVLHGCYIPAFRAQRNIVPGRETIMWFQATAMGDYDLFCNQYCGEGHSLMGATVHVVSQEAYDAKTHAFANPFVDAVTKQPIPYAKVGEKLYASMGCSQCHSIDGSKGTGPTWHNMYFTTQPFADGNSIQGVTGTPTPADWQRWDAYINESIIYPNAKIVAGFNAGVMPDFTGQLESLPATGFGSGSVKQKKTRALLQYIKSVSDKYDAKADPDPQIDPPAGPTTNK
jgi:cytochrome c oxidase subunit 2